MVSFNLTCAKVPVLTSAQQAMTPITPLEPGMEMFER